MKKLLNKKYFSIFVFLYVVTLLIGIFITTPSQACACGMLIPQGGKDIAMEGEKGIVVFDGLKNNEQMVIDFQLNGTSNNSALIVPTPVKPDISQVKKEVFKDLQDILFPPSDNTRDGAAPTTISNSVEVLERKTVGNFEIAVLKTNSYTDLYDWTKENGFYLQAEAESPVRTYIDNGFILNVIKLKKGADISNINPLKFTFETKTIFYPLMEVKDERDSLKDKSLDLYLITDGMIATSSAISNNYSLIKNQVITKTTLDQKITKTNDPDFSNLDFISNKYYVTYLTTTDYSADASLVSSLGNPGSNEYAPLGLDYSQTKTPILLMWAFPIIFVVIFIIAAFIFFIWRSKQIVQKSKPLITNELAIIPGATIKDNPVNPTKPNDKII